MTTRRSRSNDPPRSAAGHREKKDAQPAGTARPSEETFVQRLGVDTAAAAATLSAADAGARSRSATRLQEVLGNQTVQRALAKASAPAVDDRLAQLVVDGVMAFETLGNYYPPVAPEIPVPEIPSGAPEGLQASLGHLRTAKQFRFEAGMPGAQEAVKDRLAAEGPLGFARLVLQGPSLVLRERLSRAHTAKAEWQAARPVLSALVTRYAGMEGSNADYADSLKRLVSSLDVQMTERIATLDQELAATTSPAEAERAKAIAEAKEAVGVMDRIVAAVELAGVAEHAKSSVVDRHAGVGDHTAAKPRPSAGFVEEMGRKDLTGEDPLTASQEELFLEVRESRTSAAFTKGLDALEGVKKLIGVYESGGALGEALARFSDPQASGLDVAKAEADIAKAILTPVHDAGALLLQGSAEVMDRYASRLGKQLKITESLAMTKSAERLRGFAESLGHLEKVTGVIGIFSGALSAIEGVSSNDVEAAVGGVLDVAEGVVGLAAEGATSTAAAVGFLQVRGMLKVTADMSRALQAVRNAGLRSAVTSIAGDLDTAALHAHLYSDALEEWARRLGSPDPVERQLAEQFGMAARRQVAPLHNAIGSAVSSAVQGRLTRYPVLADTFCAPFGGRDMARALLLDLADGPAGGAAGLNAHAEFLKGLFPALRTAVGDLSLTMDALDREGRGKVKFAETARNTLKLSTRVDLSGGGMSISYDAGKIGLEGPIDDAKYRAWIGTGLGGRTLGQIDGFRFELTVEVLSDTVTLSGSDSTLWRHEGLSAETAVALAKFSGEAAEQGSVDAAAKALWRSHMQVHIPAGTAF